MQDETTYKLLRAIEANPDTNQRQLATELEMSLGKLNYCLKALLDKGLVKAENFIASNNKRGYLYQLTPAGISEKAAVTLRFLNHKLAEYKKLKQEIASLQSETTPTMSLRGGVASEAISLSPNQSEQSVKSVDNHPVKSGVIT